MERPCKNCKQLKNDHRTLQYTCDIDRLPVQLQEMYYLAAGRNDPLIKVVTYSPMDNLQYLEHQYYKELNDTPTRESLR